MAIFDNLKIASYAAAAEAYDKSRDFFEGFLPLVETALYLNCEKASVSFLELQQRINEIHGVKIPKDTLRHLIRILESQGKVEFDQKRVLLADGWLSDSAGLIDANQVSTNILFQKFRDYLSGNGCSVSISDIRSQVCEWIYLYSSDLAKFVASGANKSSFHVEGKGDWEHADQLIAFLVECYTKSPDIYKTFIRLYDGAVQASLLNFTPKEIALVANPEFLVKKAVLDTNFVLRLLGLQSSLDNEVARSTFQALREVGVKFYVLPQTIGEVCTSVDGFLRETAPVAQSVAAFLPKTNIATSGFWSALQNGISRSDFLKWTDFDNVSSELQEQYSVTIVEGYSEPTFSEDEINDLVQYKSVEKYTDRQARHDLTMIAYCRGVRPKHPRSLATADWWVLTNDVKLASWDRQYGKFQTCMTGVQVSNMLWLFTQKDAGEGLTNTIVSLAGRNALSSTEISNFATRMAKYAEESSGDQKRANDLANVLAHAVLSTNDVKVGSSSDKDFLDVIDQRAKEIYLQQRLKEEKHQDIANSQAQEIVTLKRDLKREKLLSKRHQTEDDIGSSEKSIAETQSNIAHLKELQDFCSKQERSVARKLLIIFLAISLAAIVLAVFLFKAFENGPFKACLAQFIKIADLFATLSGAGIALLVPTAIYYIIVIFCFNSPYNPAALFVELKNRRILKWRHNYIIEHRFSSDFAHGLLDVHHVNLENRLKQEEASLSSLRAELAEIEDELCRIQN